MATPIKTNNGAPFIVENGAVKPTGPTETIRAPVFVEGNGTINVRPVTGDAGPAVPKGLEGLYKGSSFGVKRASIEEAMSQNGIACSKGGKSEKSGKSGKSHGKDKSHGKHKSHGDKNKLKGDKLDEAESDLTEKLDAAIEKLGDGKKLGKSKFNKIMKKIAKKYHLSKKGQKWLEKKIGKDDKYKDQVQGWADKAGDWFKKVFGIKDGDGNKVTTDTGTPGTTVGQDPVNPYALGGQSVQGQLPEDVPPGLSPEEYDF